MSRPAGYPSRCPIVAPNQNNTQSVMHKPKPNDRSTHSQVQSPTTAASGSLATVHVHNPTNINMVTQRQIPESILGRSLFFKSKLGNLSSGLDLPSLHIVADPLHFDIIIKWMRSDVIKNHKGDLPNLYTLGSLIFLADRLELWDLVGRLLQMIKGRQYFADGSSMQSYSDIYQKTRPGNFFRNYAVECYLQSLAPGSHVPLDLPSEMMVDLVNMQHQKHIEAAIQWEKIANEKIQKTITDMRISHQKEISSQALRFNDRLAKRIVGIEKAYAEKWDKAMWEAKKGFEEKFAQDLKDAKQAHIKTLNTSPSADLEAIIKKSDERIAEIHKMNYERYTNLVNDTMKRNTEQAESLLQLSTAHELREARLREENERLSEALVLKRTCGENQGQTQDKSIELNTTTQLADALERTRTEVAGLEKALTESQEKVNELKMVNSELEARLLKETAGATETLEARIEECRQKDQRDVAALKMELSSLRKIKAGTEDRHQIELANCAREHQHAAAELRAAYDDLKASNETEVAGLKRLLSNCEERNCKEVAHLQLLHREAEQKLEDELAAHKMMLEAHTDQSRKRIQDLKRAHAVELDNSRQEIDASNQEIEALKAGINAVRESSAEESTVHLKRPARAGSPNGKPREHSLAKDGIRQKRKRLQVTQCTERMGETPDGINDQ